MALCTLCDEEIVDGATHDPVHGEVHAGCLFWLYDSMPIDFVPPAYERDLERAERS